MMAAFLQGPYCKKDPYGKKHIVSIDTEKRPSE